MVIENQAGFLAQLKERVLVFDGGMGTSLQGMGLAAEGGCWDALSLSAPEAVTAVHRSFLAAGADVIETNTFRANRPALAAYGLAEQMEAINRAAAGLARRVADEWAVGERPRWVAGAMGPVGIGDGAEGLPAVFAEQAAALLAGGVDLIVLETFREGVELAAAVEGVQQAMAATGRWRPIQAQVSPGREVERPLLDVLLALPVAVIGLNCGFGAAEMGEALAYLAGRSEKPLACLPNAGLPVWVGGVWVYGVGAAEFAGVVAGFVREYGVRVVGGCCGTTPGHIETLVKRGEKELLTDGKKHG